MRIARHELLVAALILTAVVSLAYRDVVFAGKTLRAGSLTPGVMGSAPPYGFSGTQSQDAYRLDQVGSTLSVDPLASKVHNVFFHLHMPLWNANAGTGGPLLADMITAPLDLLKLPVFLSPSPVIWDVYLLGRFIFAGFVTVLFTRRLGVSLPGSLVAAIGYVLSGFFVLYSNNSFLDVYISLPLVLYAVELVVQRGHVAGTVLLAIAVALALLGGMPEASFLSLLFAGGYALYRVGVSTLDEGGFVAFRRRLILVSVGFAAGFGLAAPALLPFVEFVRNSYTTHTDITAPGTIADPLRFGVGMLVPYFNGPPWTGVAGAGFSGTRNWSGIVVSLLAVVGLWNTPLMRRAGWFFVVAAALCLAKLYGLPGVNELGRLPLARLTSIETWIWPVVGFSIAFLAGLGADRVYRGERLGWSIHVAALAILATLGCLLLLNRPILAHVRPEQLRWLAAALVILALTWLWLTVPRGTQRGLGWVCLALVVGELVLLVPHGIYLDRYDPYTQPPYVKFLQQQQSTPGRGRVFAIGAILFPDDASVYGLDDVRDVNAIWPSRYMNYILQFLRPSATGGFTGFDDGLPSQQRAALGSPFFNLMGPKYLLMSKAGLPPDGPDSLIDNIIRRLGSSPAHDSAPFLIDGDERPVLVAIPPSDIPLDVNVTPSQQFLRFSAAISPGAWSEPTASGVTFQVFAAPAGGQPQLVWQRLVDAAHNPNDRHWLDADIDLAPYGQNVSLILRTLPNVNTNYAWSGWGSLRLTDATDNSDLSRRFPLIYDHEIKIYENQDALPRAVVLHRLREVADASAAASAIGEPGFDPKRLAVVEGTLSAAESNLVNVAPESDSSAVTIRSYADDRVAVTASLEHAGLVLLTDTYYPGWKASLDGRPVQIHPTDYAFRGVIVPEGTHELVFEYDPASFKLGALVALLTALGLAGFYLGVTVNSRRAEKR